MVSSQKWLSPLAHTLIFFFLCLMEYCEILESLAQANRNYLMYNVKISEIERLTKTCVAKEIKNVTFADSSKNYIVLLLTPR